MYSKDEVKDLKLKFWNTFQQKSARLRSKHGKTRKWMLYKTGIRGVELKFDISRQYADVAIEIHHNDVYVRLEMYEKFEQVRKIMNESYGHPLQWNDHYVLESGKEVCRIWERYPDANILDQNTWPATWTWMMQRMLALETTFDEVQTFLKFHIDNTLNNRPERE